MFLYKKAIILPKTYCFQKHGCITKYYLKYRIFYQLMWNYVFARGRPSESLIYPKVKTIGQKNFLT